MHIVNGVIPMFLILAIGAMTAFTLGVGFVCIEDAIRFPG